MLKAIKEILEPKGLPDLLGLLDHKEMLEQMDQLDLPDLPGPLELLDLLGLLDPPGHKDRKEIRVPLGLKEHREHQERLDHKGL